MAEKPEAVYTKPVNVKTKKVNLSAGGKAFFKIDLQQDTEAGPMQCADHFGEILLASEFGTEGTVETSAVTPVIGSVFQIAQRISSGSYGPGAQSLLHSAEAPVILKTGQGKIDRHELYGGDTETLQIRNHFRDALKCAPVGETIRLSRGETLDMKTVDQLFFPFYRGQRALGGTVKKCLRPERRTAAGHYFCFPAILDDEGLFNRTGERIHEPDMAAAIAVQPFTFVKGGNADGIDSSDPMLLSEGNIHGLSVLYADQLKTVLFCPVKYSTEDDVISVSLDHWFCGVGRRNTKPVTQWVTSFKKYRADKCAAAASLLCVTSSSCLGAPQLGTTE